jgi:site-specific recombinase XerD
VGPSYAHTYLKHSIATHLLDAEADLVFVKHWLGHKNIQNTTIDAQLTTGRQDQEALCGSSGGRKLIL